MVATPVQLSLDSFLASDYIEASPAWEYLHNAATQKPMPKFRHSMLQKRLLTALASAEPEYLALPELRCTFGDRSIVPDIAVIAFENIPLDEQGEPEDNFVVAPDWSIEILSPNQNVHRVVDNLLHCLKFGTKLGWLIDPGDRSILVLTPNEEPRIFRGDTSLPVLPDIAVELTAQSIFQWLTLGKN
ncbi:MAG: Uma2 family endonuclease [Limnothrix sp.]